MDNKPEEKKTETKEPVLRTMNKVGNSEPKEVKEEVKKTPVEVKPKSRDERISERAVKLYKKAKEDGGVWVTLADKNKNYWNSGDWTHFFVAQGRCKKLPEELSPIIENALSEQNKMLVEATDEELKTEMRIRAEGELIAEGEINAKRFVEHGQEMKW